MLAHGIDDLRIIGGGRGSVRALSADRVRALFSLPEHVDELSLHDVVVLLTEKSLGQGLRGRVEAVSHTCVATLWRLSELLQPILDSNRPHHPRLDIIPCRKLGTGQPFPRHLLHKRQREPFLLPRSSPRASERNHSLSAMFTSTSPCWPASSTASSAAGRTRTTARQTCTRAQAYTALRYAARFEELTGRKSAKSWGEMEMWEISERRSA